MKKGTQVKVIKLSDEKFNNDHPNGINIGYEKIGVLVEDIKLFNPIRIGGLTTSWVTEIIDENTFRTRNSIYRVIPYNAEFKVINNTEGITSDYFSSCKKLIIWNNGSEWYGASNVTGIVELSDKIIINFGGCFTEYDFDKDFQAMFEITDEQVELLIKQV